MKEYENISDRDQLGYAPGEVFDADIPEAQEARLVERGAIRVVGESTNVTEGNEGDEEQEGGDQLYPDSEQPSEPGDDPHDTTTGGDAAEEGDGFS